jgi:hypothetical protein
MWMAKAEQLKALLQSHAEGDDARFFAVAMQIAAHEARLGHGAIAAEHRRRSPFGWRSWRRLRRTVWGP